MVGLIGVGFLGWNLLTPPKRHTVTYVVTMPRSQDFQEAWDVTYTTADGGRHHIGDEPVKRPWRHTITAGSGQVVWVSARNAPAGGKIVCELLIDGRSVQTSVSEGYGTTVSCGGHLP